MSKALPRELALSFHVFLASRGHQESNCNAALKIAWLMQLLEQSPMMPYETFATHARQLGAVGPDRLQELERQATIVRAFVATLQRKNYFRPLRPHRAMPLHVFEKLVGSFDCQAGSGLIAKARMVTQLKVGWWAGLQIRELKRLRKCDLQRLDNGYALSGFGGHELSMRTIMMAKQRRRTLCAVEELERWQKTIPMKSDDLLFPRTDVRGRLHEPRLPFFTHTFSATIRRRLADLGFPWYSYTSIRVSFVKRSRDQLGDAAAFALSGHTQYRAYRWLLRGEPEFIEKPVADDL